jgi:hypothetical protein
MGRPITTDDLVVVVVLLSFIALVVGICKLVFWLI